jgi:hypothetical protein
MSLTDTELKLRDAATQMKLALQPGTDDETLRSCINAYLSHARSVTFVMQKESSDYPELMAWYDGQMSHLKELPIMKFFNEKRVHTIHKGVVKPIKHVTPVWDLKVNGVPQPGQGTMTFWQFDGVGDFIPGSSGGVFRLCEQYFMILRRLVIEWLKKRKELGIT